MLALSGNPRIFLYNEFVDMRKGFEGLSAMVEQAFAEKLTSGAYFAFLNRRRNRMKVLYWDVDGLVIWYKRLEKGCFTHQKLKQMSISRRDFVMLLEGVIPKRLKHRYSVP